jgi:flagellar biosynthesis protein FliQ
MTPSIALELMQQAILVTMVAAGPIVISAMIVGIAIAVFQALTQVQEMTLTFVPKMLVGAVVMALSAPYIGNVLRVFTEQVYLQIEKGIQP